MIDEVSATLGWDRKHTAKALNGRVILGEKAKKRGSKNDKWILDAQLAVDTVTEKHPDYEGNVRSVYTHPLSHGGNSNSHYNGRSQTWMVCITR
jgi:hypothetical protein